MSKFAEYFRMAMQLVEGSLPFLLPILAFIPGLKLPAAALTILGSIPALCHTAEELIGEGNGEQKKALVTSMVASAVNTMRGVSTGGQAETWERVSQLVSPAIELAVNNAKIIASTQAAVAALDRPTGA